VSVTPIRWQKNTNLCGSPRSSESSESQRVLDVISARSTPRGQVELMDLKDRLVTDLKDVCTLDHWGRVGSPRRFRACRISTSHPQHVSYRITDSPGVLGHGYRSRPCDCRRRTTAVCDSMHKTRPGRGLRPFQVALVILGSRLATRGWGARPFIFLARCTRAPLAAPGGRRRR
jgi:hypothetical protein